MQQRQLRLGDILDDYCPRERRLTNHVVVAMVGEDVKQTRCTTCDADHEYKHARVPRQRRKSEAPTALYSQVLAGAPKRIAHEPEVAAAVNERPLDEEAPSVAPAIELPVARGPVAALQPGDAASIADGDGPKHDAAESNMDDRDDDADDNRGNFEEGPVHRPLIRATLPRPEGQPPAARPAPDFTIRQPTGRPNRFRRHPRGPQQFQGGRNGNAAGGHLRSSRPGGRPPQGEMNSRPPRRHGPGGKRSK